MLLEIKTYKRSWHHHRHTLLSMVIPLFAHYIPIIGSEMEGLLWRHNKAPKHGYLGPMSLSNLWSPLIPTMCDRSTKVGGIS